MSNIDMSVYYALTHFELNEAYKCPENMTHTRVPRPIVGTYFLISGIILILIYLPCFIVMIRSKCRAPSYQLMIILGVFDLISLLVNSIVTGILGIMGASFCTYPKFIFVTGAIGMGVVDGSLRLLYIDGHGSMCGDQFSLPTSLFIP
ncbi:hypothetical protein CAEBREN_20042 [Caenorhabditis brenneri]|uniref:G-protein coupled receptors family 1 profile domain-containing protein n=1 Tax=Caenorhabditis brenneri TaxID=135651 RepID=G0MU34_CAEBE|nr:hypothetical protein CAEBREN_20042 [Caenorhabditis brenneri]